MALNFPDSPGIGSIFRAPSGFNYEWDGTVWKSYNDASTSNIKILDDIGASFNGSDTTFPLTIGSDAFYPTNSQQLRVVLGGVVQEPVTDYYVSSSNIVFTTAPKSGLTISIVSLGPAVPVTTPDLGIIYNRQTYTPNSPQTTFAVTYTVGYLDVYHNGVKLLPGTDFTATNGTSFDLTVAAQNGDVVEALAYNQQNVYAIIPETLNTLNVLGITTLSDPVYISDSIVHTGDTNTKIRFPTNDTFTVETNGTERLRVASDGEVIIPGNLTVQGTTTTLDTILTEVDKIEVGANNTTVGVAITQSGTGNGLTVDDGLVRVITVADGGNVGVGATTQPALKLDVLGGFRFAGEALENVKITAGTLLANQNINLADGMVHYFTSNETGISTANIRIDGSTSLNSRMDIGNTAAVTILITPNSVGYSTCINIDGSFNDVKWLGGTGITTGSTSGIDAYTYQIIKTASSTFTVLGNRSNFV